MYLLVGLGNPAPKYVHTRHNVGFMAIDYLQQNLQSTKFVFKKSDNFMNESGESVKKFVDYYKLDIGNLYVVHDDLDLPLGEYKIQLGVGPKLHGGINSIELQLDSPEFWRIRIGVDNRDSENRISGEDYVLHDFTAEELQKLEPVFESIAQDLANINE